MTDEMTIVRIETTTCEYEVAARVSRAGGSDDCKHEWCLYENGRASCSACGATGTMLTPLVARGKFSRSAVEGPQAEELRAAYTTGAVLSLRDVTGGCLEGCCEIAGACERRVVIGELLNVVIFTVSWKCDKLGCHRGGRR